MRATKEHVHILHFVPLAGSGLQHETQQMLLFEFSCTLRHATSDTAFESHVLTAREGLQVMDAGLW